MIVSSCSAMDFILGFFHSLFHYITPLFTKDADIVIINLIDINIKLKIFDIAIGNDFDRNIYKVYQISWNFCNFNLGFSY